MLVIAAIGSVAAGISAELAWVVVVTTAVVGAFTTWMELRMQGRTYGNYHVTAEKMDRKLSEWRIAPPDKQANPDFVAQMVYDCEMIFRDEEITWMRQALQSQMAAEQTLVKNLNEWTNNQLEDITTVNVDKWLSAQPADQFLSDVDDDTPPTPQQPQAQPAASDHASHSNGTASSNGNNGSKQEQTKPQDSTAG